MRIEPAAPPYPPSVTEDFTKLMPPGMEPLQLFRVLAKNPRLLGRVRRGGLLDPGSITLRQRELVILRTTALNGAEYEWGVHVAFFGGAAGFDEAALHATVHGGESSWTAGERALVLACDELHATGRLSDTAWAALRACFDDAQILEIVALAGLYRMISYVIHAAQLPPEPTAPRFPTRAR
jgi:alkylhydroperoxidase family enzyme